MTSELMSDWESRAIVGVHTRRAVESDWDALRDRYDRAFGGVKTADFEAWKRQFRLEDIAVVEDVSEPRAPRIVGTAAIIRTTVTVPGGAQLEVAACAQGMVATTHQKRGIYAKVQAELMTIAMETGADVLAAMPGPGGSYAYVGVATYTRHLRIDRRCAKLRVAEPDSGSVREVGLRETVSELRQIYARWQQSTPGALSRSEFWWPSSIGDEPFIIVHPDGYVIYDLVGDAVVVRDFCALTVSAHRELLRCLLGHGEYTEIRMDTAVDDPTPLLLEDLRTAAVSSVDAGVWMWIINLAKAIRARSFAADFQGVIDVADPWGMSSGTFALEISGGKGTWEPAPDGARADVRVSPLEMTTAYFGAHTVGELERAGRVEELTPGAVTALDRAFAPGRRPFNTTPF
ncbi:GNAT family N-acetyltransferase [Nocardia uniformis]|uniref:GNAT family N-acetyltransferase n=1 Tax=Nocardia uniformis TaxID=53432 RepID=A0A849C7N7_9NOCA|nr:GNAT family N-acetyltransferase [Nocardia uniformis]NNH74783.1 GNAT family N-acetyltransferase [Nocardia uniformis]